MPKTLPTVDSLSLINLPHHFEDNGDLVVIEGMVHVPFNIARVFVVRAPKGSIRGQHAHKACAQFLNCPRGSVTVTVDDGNRLASFELTHPNVGLYLPPGIWAEQLYNTDDSALTVLCDRRYEKEDYIRIYSEFINYRLSLSGIAAS